MGNKDLSERLFVFAVNVIKLLQKIGNTEELRVIKHQLSKSATSVGANYEESQGSGSRADFSNKIRISLKEIRESNYWLRLLKAISTKEIENLKDLINESEELKKILGSIAFKTSKN